MERHAPVLQKTRGHLRAWACSQTEVVWISNWLCQRNCMSKTFRNSPQNLEVPHSRGYADHVCLSTCPALHEVRESWKCSVSLQSRLLPVLGFRTALRCLILPLTDAQLVMAHWDFSLDFFNKRLFLASTQVAPWCHSWPHSPAPGQCWVYQISRQRLCWWRGPLLSHNWNAWRKRRWKEGRSSGCSI